MSEVADQEGGSGSLPDVLGDAEACKELNQEELLSRVRSVRSDSLRQKKCTARIVYRAGMESVCLLVEKIQSCFVRFLYIRQHSRIQSLSEIEECMFVFRQSPARILRSADTTAAVNGLLGTSAALALVKSPQGRAELTHFLTPRRKMNEEMEATRIPLHDVPVALVVENMTREKMAVSNVGLPCLSENIPGRAVRTKLDRDARLCNMTL